MEITKATYKVFTPCENNKWSRAVCSLVFDGELMVHKVFIQGEDESNLSVIFPSQTQKTQTKGLPPRDVFHPVNSEFRNYLIDTVIDGYLFCRDTKEDIFYP